MDTVFIALPWIAVAVMCLWMFRTGYNRKKKRQRSTELEKAVAAALARRASEYASSTTDVMAAGGRFYK